MKIKKSDTVLITKGKYRGKTGKVLKAMPKENRLIVEGVNIVKKNVRPKKTGEKGKIAEMPAPIYVSCVKLICKNCKKAIKISYKVVLKKDKKVKIRICRKCGKEI